MDDVVVLMVRSCGRCDYGDYLVGVFATGAAAEASAVRAEAHARTHYCPNSEVDVYLEPVRTEALVPAEEVSSCP